MTKKQFFKKTKVIPQKKAREQLPRISRSIPEWGSVHDSKTKTLNPSKAPQKSPGNPFTRALSWWKEVFFRNPFWKLGIVGIVSLAILVTIVMAWFDLQRVFLEKEKLQKERTKILKNITYWEKIAQKYKGYRDAYFQLAILEYRLGHREEARKYLQEVFALDPNFELGRKFEQLLKE